MQKSEHEEQLCRNILYLRAVHGLTQKQMALIIGFSTASLRKIEKGGPIPRLNSTHLHRLCNAFQLSADELIFSCLENKQER